MKRLSWSFTGNEETSPGRIGERAGSGDVHKDIVGGLGAEGFAGLRELRDDQGHVVPRRRRAEERAR
jgi:hypothetical protein